MLVEKVRGDSVEREPDRQGRQTGGLGGPTSGHPQRFNSGSVFGCHHVTVES